MNKLLLFAKKYPVEIVLVIFALSFSFWLMFHTFSYNDGQMLITGKAWSDFASHVPLVRSFSFGDNFPPEFPLFPGPPIRYHFLFYLLVGYLEKIGLRIDYALNIPSALSFAALVIVIYFFAKTLFKSRAVGVLSVVFFLLNGSLSFLEFFKDHPLSTNTIQDITANTTFPSFAPYGKSIVSAFWNLNIYTNQRHLALPLAFLFAIVLFIIKFEKRQKHIPIYSLVVIGILIGILPFSHSSVFIMALSVLGILLLLLPKLRKSIFLILLIGGLLSLPRILFLKETATFIPTINLNYLVPNLSILSFLYYWLMNLGLFFFLIPIGVLISPLIGKKVFFAFLSLFFIGHTIQFSPEIAANHKFFNAFLILGNMFAAYLLARLWNWHILSKLLVSILIFLMTLSGIIDFFPIKNDSKIALADYPKNQDVAWIIKNTEKNSIFLNSTYLYHPASLAGRKIFLGWPYFPWSAGYDTLTRDNLRKSLLNSTNLDLFCKESKKNNINYVELNISEKYGFPINYSFFDKNIDKVYKSTISDLSIYDINKSCNPREKPFRQSG